MQATYNLSEKDLLEGQTCHAGVLFRMGQLFGAVLLIAGLGGIVFAEERLQALIPVLIGLILLFRIHLSAKLLFKRDFAGQDEIKLAVSDSGIEFLTGKGSGNLKWSAFLRYTETKHLFMLYSQSNIFNLIPKRAFDPQDLLEFRQMLQQNLAARSATYDGRVSPKIIVLLAVVIVMAVLLFVVLFRSKG